MIFDKKFSFDTFYGKMYMYFFKDNEDNVYIWKTSKFISDLNPNTEIEIKGTIKDHSKYNGIKQNVLTRCKIKNQGSGIMSLP